MIRVSLLVASPLALVPPGPHQGVEASAVLQSAVLQSAVLQR